jgi:dynein heavy chain
MQVIRLSHKNYLDVIESALSEGSTVLLENIGETVCIAKFHRA